MKYIESPYTDAYRNMALEEYVFQTLPREDEYFMLWQNQNAIVVGRYQHTPAEINPDYVQKNGIQVVRRLSGGGAMYQDLGNLNFTFVVNQNKAKALDFTVFIQPVVRALAKMGVEARQSSRNDIVIGEQKISGNAQYNKDGRTMHHGTMLYASRLETLGAALRPSAEKMASKGVASVRSRVTNIESHLPQPLPLAQFKTLLCEEMFRANALVPYTLSKQDAEAIEGLSNEKYASYEWNWGASPPGQMVKKRRYDFGEVQLFLDVKDGRIATAQIAGDFFGNGDVAQLAARLRGCRLMKEDILAALAETEVGSYISGMKAQTLAELVLY